MELIITIWIMVAILFSILAYAVHNRKQYHYVSHYHHYSDSEKKELEQSGYFVRIGRFMWGVAVLWVLSIPFVALEIEYAMEASLTVFLLYVLIGVFIIRRSDVKRRRKRNSRILLIVYATVAIVLGFVFIQGQQDTKVKINSDTIAFEGMYDYTLPIKEITSVEWLEEMPEDTYKLNGYATTWRSLGHFKSDAYGKGVHYVFPNKPPFIIIKAKHTYVIINSRDKEKTERLYDRIHDTLEVAGLEH
ncbi:DUF3784 domain-containing protein [Bacillus sp. 1P06AnD]|uniref:DUF3784 domain-containing protein n=1 Tax=Bacillus sp. 1P06AnD TaxID=3132208 RepID=UPI00399EEF40